MKKRECNIFTFYDCSAQISYCSHSHTNLTVVVYLFSFYHLTFLIRADGMWRPDWLSLTISILYFMLSPRTSVLRFVWCARVVITCVVSTRQTTRARVAVNIEKPREPVWFSRQEPVCPAATTDHAPGAVQRSDDRCRPSNGTDTSPGCSCACVSVQPPGNPCGERRRRLANLFC